MAGIARPALASLDVAGVAEYIRSGACRSIVVLTGAGVSTSAGIPDFRSPGGMYATLRPELLTATPEQQERMRADPVNVVRRDMFFENQFPYMEVRRPFILGSQERQWRATLSHWFMAFLAEEQLLTRLFTQNIDGLDYHTDVPRDKVCNVHGSIGRVTCESCDKEMPLDDFCAEVRSKIKDIYGVDQSAPEMSSNISCPSCGNPTVKPSTVLFGGSLPGEFSEFLENEVPQADLLIVAGTSLVVAPANMVVTFVGNSCPRLIVNKEPVGQELGVRYGSASTRDVFAGDQGGCDEVFMQLIKALGWEEKVRKIRHLLPEGSEALLEGLRASD